MTGSVIARWVWISMPEDEGKLRQKLIAAKWEISETNRKTRVYRLTPAGRKHLHASLSRWDQFVQAMSRVLKPTEES